MHLDHSRHETSSVPAPTIRQSHPPMTDKQTRIDPAEIRRALSVLTESQQVVELRILHATTKAAPRYTFQASGYFNDTEALIKALFTLHTAKGVYITLQPCNPVLLARAQNRLRTADEMRKASATADTHIIAYRWLLIDIDPDRPADISSSEEEHLAALEHARYIRQVLREEDWPEPIYADSGNGGHLLYSIALSVSEADLVKRVLAGLAVRFDVEGAPGEHRIGLHIDQAVYNPSRICKLYGTLACKGDNTQERPHRMARMLQAPGPLESVSRESLEAIAALAPVPVSSTKTRQHLPTIPFDLAAWIQEYHLDVLDSVPWSNGGKKWIFRVCPWNAEHTDRSAYIVQRADGAIAAGCHHNGCQGKDWKALRMLYEPGAYSSSASVETSQQSGTGYHLLARPSDERSFDTALVDRALAEKNFLAILHLIPILAQLSRGDYMIYKCRIKEAFGKEINLNDLDAAVSDARKAAQQNNGDAEEKSQADILVELAEREVSFFATPGGICYAHMPVREHYETWPIHERGGMFKLWILKRFRDELGTIPNDKALASALMTLASNALYGDTERQEVFTRLGFHNGKIYLDLANQAHQVVEIDQLRWRVLSQAPVYFRRYNGVGALPVPQRGGSLALLDPFINADAEDLLLAKAWVIGCLHPTGPYPILGVHGERGAAKTTAAKILRSLVDPCVALLRSAPKDVQALTIAAANNHVIGFDNLSTMPAWLSDALCRTSTGAGDAYRQLYTDADEVVFNYIKPIIFTGIEEVGTRGDFLDRCLLITLPAIEKTRRKTEKEFLREFQAAHPLILGALLDAASLALQNYARVALPELPRMADFATWIAACESAILPREKPLGYFIEIYFENREEAVEIEIEASPTGAAIKAFMEARRETGWSGTADELLQVLNEHVLEDTRHERSWPKNGRALSSKLKRLATSLRSMGIQVRWSKVNGQRIITLQRVSLDQGDAKEGKGDVKRGPGDTNEISCDPASIDSRSSRSARVTQMDANPPVSSFIESPQKEEKEKREEIKEKKERGKFASFASPASLDPLADDTQAGTQTDFICVPLASPNAICVTQGLPSGHDVTMVNGAGGHPEVVQGTGTETVHQDNEGLELLNRLKKRTTRMTHFLWNVPNSGYPNGYLPSEEYYKRLKACLYSKDLKQREAAVEEIKKRVPFR